MGTKRFPQPLPNLQQAAGGQKLEPSAIEQQKVRLQPGPSDPEQLVSTQAAEPQEIPPSVASIGPTAIAEISREQLRKPTQPQLRSAVRSPSERQRQGLANSAAKSAAETQAPTAQGQKVSDTAKVPEQLTEVQQSCGTRKKSSIFDSICKFAGF